MRPSSPQRFERAGHACEARASHQPARPAARPVGGADRLQLGQQCARRLEGQRDVLHVHDRIGEAGVDEHVADVVHVDEAIRVRACRRRPRTRARSSRSVSGPNVVNDSSPPTLSTRRNSANARGRSFTHCSARLLHTRSTHTPGNGSALMSAQTNRGAAAPRAGASGASSRRSSECCVRARRRAASTIGSAMSNASTCAPG